MSFNDWCTQKSQEIPQFQFWYTTLQLELVILSYVRSLREGNFDLYLDSLTHLAPWYFSLDHTNYARWLPIHIRDMALLKTMHPEVSVEFRQGHFTVKKTSRSFSAIALDQAHEQNNASIKGDGGAVGLTQSPDGLRRWMVAGPEIVRMTAEFERCLETKHSHLETRHHEQRKSTQVTFGNHVSKLVEVMEEMGNPFLEETTDLLRLHTRDIMDPKVVSAVRQAEEIGQQQYQAFVTDRLLERSTPISETIKKNMLSLFSCPPRREKSKANLQVASLKNDCSLFSRLYIACQSRDGNLHEFFCHENQPWPPSLSENGKLRQGTKSELTGCLESCLHVDARQDAPDIDVVILDGAVVVNFLKPVAVKTFDDYALKVFLPYVRSQLDRANRIDVVWDQYKPNSLKSQTRDKRGKGVRKRVNGSTNLPVNWQQFLRIDANKAELFSFLAQHITTIDATEEIVTTQGEEVYVSVQRDTSRLSPCNHEEADTRMILHVADAIHEGYKKILLRTVDTDVVVLAVAAAAKLSTISDLELWVAFGTGKHFRYIPVHEIAACIGPQRSEALPLFHAYTGCDTVSSFAGRGKKTAWDVWKSYGDVTATFLGLSTGAEQVSDKDVAVLEHFTILLYDRTSSLTDIDEARFELFTKKGRTMETLPPTKAALVQHIKRAVYQGGHCWGHATVAAPEMPSPENCGWTEPSNWKPVWTTLPEAAVSSRELLRCGCKKGCRGRCACKKAALRCTALCQCGGGDCDL